MFGNTFYHGLHRKYVALFGTLFNDIHIERPHDSVVDTVKVPLTYSSQDKMLARVFGDDDLTRKVAAKSPAMSFEMMAPYYDAERKLISTNKMCIVGDDGTKYSYIGVPYIIPFKLYVYARENEDGLRVIESILPYFTPSLTVSAKVLPEMEHTIDIPIILKNIDFEDDSYGDLHNRRKLIWTLSFEMKVEFIGPVIGNKKIIRFIHVNLRDKTGLDILEEVHIEPGLTANGTPTSVRADSIPAIDINEDDDFGYIIEINEGPDPHP